MKNYPRHSTNSLKSCKKLFSCLALLLTIALLTGCNPKTTAFPASETDSEAQQTDDTESTTARFEILEATDDHLLVCGLENATGLYSIGHGSIREDAGGQPIQTGDLKTGMIVDLTWNGAVEETYPAQFTYERLKDTGKTGSPTLKIYYRLIQPLAEVDPALNEGILQCYFDFSKVDSLSDGEKEGLAYMCGRLFDVWGSLATRQELIDQGILDPEKGLEDSILITIEEISVEGNTVKCHANKYRSNLGAYFFRDVTATYSDGKYTFDIGGEMIS